LQATKGIDPFDIVFCLGEMLIGLPIQMLCARCSPTTDYYLPAISSDAMTKPDGSQPTEALASDVTGTT
jgi:hypothetical protein